MQRSGALDPSCGRRRASRSGRRLRRRIGILLRRLEVAQRLRARPDPGATNTRHRSPAAEGEDEAGGKLLEALDAEAAEEAAEPPAGARAGSNPPPSGATLKAR